MTVADADGLIAFRKKVENISIEINWYNSR